MVEVDIGIDTAPGGGNAQLEKLMWGKARGGRKKEET